MTIIFALWFQAAVEEGIVPGGGVAYLRVVNRLDNLTGENHDQNIGIGIVKRAVEEPIRQIVQNAGLEGSVIVAKVKEGKDDYGFNAYNEEYTNMFEAGVLDPTKVSRVALENAASVAALLITTETTIVEVKEDEPAGAPHAHGGMPDMY